MWTYWRGAAGVWWVGKVDPYAGDRRRGKERHYSRSAAALRAHVLNGGDKRDDIDRIEYENGHRIGDEPPY